MLPENSDAFCLINPKITGAVAFGILQYLTYSKINFNDFISPYAARLNFDKEQPRSKGLFPDLGAGQEVQVREKALGTRLDKEDISSLGDRDSSNFRHSKFQ